MLKIQKFNVYAVAVTFTKSIPSGLNIQTSIRSYESVSREEAIGKFVLEMSEKLPEHDIHLRPVAMLIETSPFTKRKGMTNKFIKDHRKEIDA